VCGKLVQLVAVCCRLLYMTCLYLELLSLRSYLQSVGSAVSAECCSMLQYVTVCCIVLQCVAVYCSVLQSADMSTPRITLSEILNAVSAVCCSMLQCVAVYCSVLQSAPRDMS